MKRFQGLFFLVVSFLFLNASLTVGQAKEMLEVKTTFYPVYYLADRIGGDQVNVSLLLDGGEDAHSYESSAQDAAEVQESDLFIYQDDEMEFFVSDLLSLIDTEQTRVLESTEGIDLLAGSQHDHDHPEENHTHPEDEKPHNHGPAEGGDDVGHSHEFDPHTWLDPMVYAQQAENVRDVLIELDPDNEPVYQENADQLITELKALDQEFSTQLASLEKRTIVVQHAAFGYLTHAYDLNQAAITGLSTSQEPSAGELAEMQNYVVDNNVQVIYVDPKTDTGIAKTVARANDAELLPLNTLEVVTAQEAEEGIDYFTMMRDNLSQLLLNQ